MARQYLRQISLLVGTGNGQAIDLSALRIKFKVNAHTLEQPNNLEAKIYNLADATAQTLRTQSEGQRVRLQVGYEGTALQTIFDGDIIQVFKGRESAIDNYVAIVAGDGDQAYNFAVVNTTLAAGAKPADKLAALAKAAKPYGVTMGYSPPDFPDQPATRGQTLFGMVRDHMRDLARSTGTFWSIQQGQLQVTNADAALPGAAIVLTPSTGLIGIPEVTADGIHVRCLINPRIVPNSTIQLQADQVNQAQFSPAYTAAADNALLPKILDGAGAYRVLKVEHEGDTRANPWYSNIICVGVGQPLPLQFVESGNIQA